MVRTVVVVLVFLAAVALIVLVLGRVVPA